MKASESGPGNTSPHGVATDPIRQEDLPHDPARKVTRAEFLQIFTAVMLPMLMAIIDQTLLASATPAIAADLGNLYDSSWIATAYLLTAAVMVPVYGRLGDRYGRRRILMVALGMFMFGALICAASQTMHQLIAGRAIQGMGGGGLMSLSFALIGELVPPRQRVSFQGYFAINSMAGNFLGPIIGGLVVAHASWRWLPAMSVPLGLLAGWRLMRLPRGARHPDAPGLSDFTGLGLFALGTLLVLFGLSSAGHRFDWLSWQTALLIGFGLLAWAWLFAHERRHHAPFFPIDLLLLPPIRQWLASAILSTFCLLALIFYLPVYFQLGLRTGAAQSGLMLTPVLLGFVLGGVLAGRRAAHTGDPKPIPVAGHSLAAVALFALVIAPPDATLVATLGFVAGLGIGPTMPLVQVVVQTVAGHDRLGAATALVVLSRTLGAALGTAVIGAVVYSILPDLEAARLVEAGNAIAPAGAEVMRAFQVAFFVTACVAVLGAVNAGRAHSVKI